MNKIADELATNRAPHPDYGPLFNLPPVAEVQHKDSEADLDLKFAAWLQANPHILEAFIAVARRALASGRRKIGGKRIAEQMRWDMTLTANGDAFKINNSYVSRLGRAAVGRCPELADLFEFRELRS